MKNQLTRTLAVGLSIAIINGYAYATPNNNLECPCAAAFQEAINQWKPRRVMLKVDNQEKEYVVEKNWDEQGKMIAKTEKIPYSGTFCEAFKPDEKNNEQSTEATADFLLLGSVNAFENMSQPYCSATLKLKGVELILKNEFYMKDSDIESANTEDLLLKTQPLHEACTQLIQSLCRS